MFSLEKMIAITGDIDYMDHLERIAFNALPTQASDDFTCRQYFQQANQVMLTRQRRNFYVQDGHGQTDLCYGLLTGYPCCTCNMHQGWPKLVQHLWYATPDRGLAAVMFAANTVTATVADNIKVQIKEETGFPFEDRLRFRISIEKPADFPFHIRIPGWCEEAVITINGKENQRLEGGRMAVLTHNWSEGDVVEVKLSMQIAFSSWDEGSVAVERGPLLYALKIREDWKLVSNPDKWGNFYEVRPLDPWNFALPEKALEDPENHFELVETPVGEAYPWSIEATPLALRTRGFSLPQWKLYNEMAGPLPHNLQPKDLINSREEEITLIPYGCTTLRITEFPVGH